VQDLTWVLSLPTEMLLETQTLDGGHFVRCHWRTASRLVLASFLLFLMEAGHLRADTAPDDDATLKSGEAIFNSNCAGCHGAEAAGGRGPSLRGQLRVGNESSDIRNTILGGIPGTGMPKFDLEHEELEPLVVYIQSLHNRHDSLPHPDGDKAKGKSVYNSNGCAGCHKIGTHGSAFGPNLTRIGAARSYDYLKTSILNPSADVPETYQAITVVTRDGKEYRGVRMNEDSFTVQLRLANQSFRSFDKQAIAREVVGTESPMPAYKFSSRNLDDLLAYLSSLNASTETDGDTAQEKKQR
jgi:cytochrome c oxidase cbb3-type subunit 3